jgi:hypothetical protein
MVHIFMAGTSLGGEPERERRAGSFTQLLKFCQCREAINNGFARSLHAHTPTTWNLIRHLYPCSCLLQFFFSSPVSPVPSPSRFPTFSSKSTHHFQEFA